MRLLVFCLSPYDGRDSFPGWVSPFNSNWRSTAWDNAIHRPVPSYFSAFGPCLYHCYPLCCLILFIDCPCSKPIILVSHIPMLFFGMLSVASDKPDTEETSQKGIVCKNKHQVQHQNSAVVDRGFTNFCEISIGSVNTSCMTSYQ